MEGSTLSTSKYKFIESRRIKIIDPPNDQSQIKILTSAHSQQTIYVGLQDGRIGAIKINGTSLETPFRVGFSPTTLTVARGGYSSILLVIGHDVCPVATAFDLTKNSTIATLKINQATGSRIIDYAWHPNYSIVALTTDTGRLLVLAIDLRNGMSLVYNQECGALTCCWSPKGKNIAIGKTDGSFFRMEPIIEDNNFAFKNVENSTIIFSNPKISSSHQLIKLRWINKTYLMAVHARTSYPDKETIFSLITVKPSKPYKYWYNIFIEIPGPKNYHVSLVNFTNCVVCGSNSSSEMSAIGVDSSKGVDLNDWHQIECDEGAGIVLPPKPDHQEALPLGVTIVNSDKPNVVVLTDDGTLCFYSAHHDENIFKVPEFQSEHPCPIKISPPAESTTQLSSLPTQTLNQLSNVKPKTSFLSLLTSRNVSQTPQVAPTPQPTDLSSLSFKSLDPRSPSRVPDVASVPPQTTQSKPNQSSATKPLTRVSFDWCQDIKTIRSRFDELTKEIQVLKQINDLKFTLDNFSEITQCIQDALKYFQGEIQELELSTLKRLHLLEFIKTKFRLGSNRSIDPLTIKKVENIKKKTVSISESLKDLEINVEVAREDFVRKNQSHENTDKRLRSLEMVYKALAMNQKIINILKSKLASQDVDPKKVQPKETQYRANHHIINRKELEPTKMTAFREFLASRNHAPVRYQ